MRPAPGPGPLDRAHHHVAILRALRRSAAGHHPPRLGPHWPSAADPRRGPVRQRLCRPAAPLPPAVPPARPLVAVVIGCAAGDGASTTGLDLAFAVAEAGHQVTLVAADPGRSALAGCLRIADDVGLSTHVDGTTDLEGPLQTTLLAAGLRHTHAGPGRRARRGGGPLRPWRPRGHLRPPVLPGGTSAKLATLGDSVARYGVTTLAEVEERARWCGRSARSRREWFSTGPPPTLTVLSSTVIDATTRLAGRCGARRPRHHSLRTPPRAARRLGPSFPRSPRPPPRGGRAGGVHVA